MLLSNDKDDRRINVIQISKNDLACYPANFVFREISTLVEHTFCDYHENDAIGETLKRSILTNHSVKHAIPIPMWIYTDKFSDDMQNIKRIANKAELSGISVDIININNYIEWCAFHETIEKHNIDLSLLKNSHTKSQESEDDLRTTAIMKISPEVFTKSPIHIFSIIFAIVQTSICLIRDQRCIFKQNVILQKKKDHKFIIPIPMHIFELLSDDEKITVNIFFDIFKKIVDTGKMFGIQIDIVNVKSSEEWIELYDSIEKKNKTVDDRIQLKKNMESKKAEMQKQKIKEMEQEEYERQKRLDEMKKCGGKNIVVINGFPEDPSKHCYFTLRTEIRDAVRNFFFEKQLYIVKQSIIDSYETEKYVILYPISHDEQLLALEKKVCKNDKFLIMLKILKQMKIEVEIKYVNYIDASINYIADSDIQKIVKETDQKIELIKQSNNSHSIKLLELSHIYIEKSMKIREIENIRTTKISESQKRIQNDLCNDAF